MKFKFIIPIICALFSLSSCSTDDADDLVLNEVEGLSNIQNFVNETHILEVYNASGSFHTGYNQLSIRIKDKTTDSYVENAKIQWMPMMQMTTMEHSAPKSEVTKADGKSTVYDGFIVFQMTHLDGSGWTLSFDYVINGVHFSADAAITVLQSSTQNVTSFKGTDNQNYVLALMEPQQPKIGVNKLEVGLYKMGMMQDYTVVSDYKMMLDPRMPGMGNHSSPNNSDLVFNAADKKYQGNLSLTMTGFWVLNLKLQNSEGELLKGRNVDTDHPKSDLYLELDF